MMAMPASPIDVGCVEVQTLGSRLAAQGVAQLDEYREHTPSTICGQVELPPVRITDIERVDDRVDERSVDTGPEAKLIALQT
jgi:hypothetical protein